MKTINRIFLFGDSWIEGQGVYEKNVNGFLQEPDFNGDLSKMREWRRENGWKKYIKKYTTAEVINNGVQGCDNYNQFKLLNKLLTTLKETDLVLFGFTSKLRDTQSYKFAFGTDYDEDLTLLGKDNPLHGMIAWEKLSLEFCNFGINPDSEDGLIFKDEKTEILTRNFIKDYFISIHDDYPFEYIAQTNYLLYQSYIKLNKANVVFFDLFEPYVDKKFVKKMYNVDEKIYINYGKKTMNSFLQDYEIKNNQVSLWECGWKRPDLANKIYHPNQHGIELYVDYLFEKVLSKQYNFE